MNISKSMEKFSKEYFYENYNVRKLQLGETVKSFDCGDTDLNDFIINEAHHYRKALSSRCGTKYAKKECRFNIARLHQTLFYR